MFGCFTLTGRFHYYETSTAFFIERMSDGEVRCVGDGVGWVYDEDGQEALEAGTPEFYDEVRVLALNEDEDGLDRAYFGRW